MSFYKLRTLGLALTLGLSVGITGCGGDSSDSIVNNASKTNEDTNNDTVEEGVVGPLDALQEPLESQVFGQLEGALAGTPLEGMIDCAGQAVVIDIIDVVDAIALALMEAAQTQDPAAFEAAAGNIQFSLEELGNDLPGALTALAGDDCNGGATDSDNGNGGDSVNPLAGTPLAPLGDALAPVLSQFPSGSDGDSEDMDLQALSALVHELATAFSGGLAQVPAEAQEAPVFGGLLTTLDTAFGDLDHTLQHLGAYEGEDTAAALEETLNHLLVNVLTEVIPVTFIEAQAGQDGAISGPITDGVNQLTAALGENLLNAALPPLAEGLDGPLAALLDPIENQLLPAILGPITDGIAGFNGGEGGDGSAGGPTGTPLDLILGPLTDALTGSGEGNDGPTGTPLDIILGPLAGGGCPFAGTPLEPACALFDAIPTP